jgi:hypothetical protein
MDDQHIDDPAQTLTEVRRLRSRSRQRAHGGAWLPAAVLAVLVLLSAVLYRYPPADPHTLDLDYPFWAGLPYEQRSAPGSYAFWLVGLPAAFIAIAAWYRFRARRIGVRVPWPVLVAVGMGALVLLVVLVAIPSEPVADPDMVASTPPPWWYGLATPLLAVAAAVVALGWVERAPGLAATGAWIGVSTWWQCDAGLLGALPGWLTWLLNGGSGPAIGGQLMLPPVGELLLIVGPLLIWVIVQAVRSRGGTR